MYKVDVYLRVRRAVMVERMSIREASRVFGLHRDTVRRMLAYSVPPGYRRKGPPHRPKLQAFTGIIDRILGDDQRVPRKQRHTAKRIFERLRDEYGFDGGYTIVKDYVREHRRQTKEMFVPLSHPPGQAQCDFGEALVGYTRRNFLVPIPSFESFEALNVYLERRCLERMEARLRGHTETIGQRLERDLDALLPLPPVAYDACEKQAVFGVNYFCRLASIILAGSPPYPDAAAGPLRSGSWGRRIPG